MSLWVDKYAPKKLSKFIDNKTHIKQITTWLSEWDDVHIKKTKKIKWNKTNPCAKSILISGSPGIGKTTAINLICDDLNYEIHEFNASDCRNKSSIKSHLSDIINNSTISFSRTITINKKIIIMDEVDGMSNGDRGGLAELTKIIKTSSVPIICICNDRQCDKMRNFVKNCYDIKFKALDPDNMKTYVKKIVKKEGLPKIKSSVLNEIIENSNGDLRNIINTVQFMINKGDASNKGDGEIESNKDESKYITPFDITKEILTLGSNHIDEKYRLITLDKNLISLFIQQNYIKSVESRHLSDLENLESISNASDNMSNSDLIDTYINKNQNYSLYPAHVMSLISATEKSTHVGMLQFPDWLGKNSTRNKSKRIVNEMRYKFKSELINSSKIFRMDYIPTIQLQLMEPLESQGKEGIKGTVDKLIEYNLSRDNLIEDINGISFKKYKLITAVKSGLTRNYNKLIKK
jgi:replication factor C subunit 1